MKITLRTSHGEDFEFVFELKKTNMKQYVDEMRRRDETFEHHEMKRKFTPGVDMIIQADGQDVDVFRLLEDERQIHNAFRSTFFVYSKKCGLG